MTNRLALIREALAELLAPLVAIDGGRIYVSQLAEQELLIHWAGRYSGSPAAELIHTEVALPLIARIAPDMLVRWSSGNLVPPKAELISPRLNEALSTPPVIATD